MERYFRLDPTQDNDLGLLPVALRDEQDLANVAAQAEDDLLDAYTHEHRPRDDFRERSLATVLDEGTAVQRYVWLKGYALDPLDALDAFAAAYRREIAGVIRWRIARDAKRPNVTTETAGGPKTSKAYRADAERRFPPDFGHALRLFAIDRVFWSI